MGSPDARQIDGLGGAEPLTSKVAIVSKSQRAGIDVDFLFAQVLIDKPLVDVSPNCGNMLAGVGPFAIERGLVRASDPATRVSIYMVNTGNLAVATVQTPGGEVRYDGATAIAGVPGYGRADQHRLPRHCRLGVRIAAADRPRARSHRRHRRHLH